jgi:hypothetical protein
MTRSELWAAWISDKKVTFTPEEREQLQQMLVERELRVLKLMKDRRDAA